MLSSKGATYKDPTGMTRRALKYARQARVPGNDERVEIASYNARSGAITPSPRETVRRLLACALSVLRVRDMARAVPRLKSGRRRERTRKPLAWKKGQVIKVLLDRKFESQAAHEKLLIDLAGRLQALGMKAAPEDSYDLVVQKGARRTVVEAKAWRQGGTILAAQAATGQLLYYADAFRRDRGVRPGLILALWRTPELADLGFVESAGIGVVWPERGKWKGTRLARRILPQLIER
jgi:hypothetical protein